MFGAMLDVPVVCMQAYVFVCTSAHANTWKSLEKLLYSTTLSFTNYMLIMFQ